jgi:hypothetical protein
LRPTPSSAAELTTTDSDTSYGPLFEGPAAGRLAQFLSLLKTTSRCEAALRIGSVSVAVIGRPLTVSAANYPTTIVPLNMSCPQVNVSSPVFAGVNSTVTGLFSGRV